MTEHVQNISNAAQNLLDGDHKAALEDLGMTDHAQNVHNAGQSLLNGDSEAALVNLGIISQSEKNQWNVVESSQVTKEDKLSDFDDTTNDIMKLTDFYLTLEEQMLF